MLAAASVSFEFFTPRSTQGVEELCAPQGRLSNYAALGPTFVSVSGAAGGNTLALLESIKKMHCIRAQLHLPRAELSEDAVVSLVDGAMRVGVADVLVLGGAPGSVQQAAAGGFGSATDLVTFLKKRYGGRLRVAVCGYPCGARGEAGDHAADLKQTALQVAAGAECVMSLPIFDVASYKTYVDELRAAGVGAAVPVLPGILPLCAPAEFRRLCRSLHLTPPAEVEAQLNAATTAQAVAATSRSSLAALTRALRDARMGAPHIYTLNSAELVADLAAAGYRPLKHRCA